MCMQAPISIRDRSVSRVDTRFHWAMILWSPGSPNMSLTQHSLKGVLQKIFLFLVGYYLEVRGTQNLIQALTINQS